MRSLVVVLGILLILLGLVGVFTNIGLTHASPHIENGVLTVEKTPSPLDRPTMLDGLWRFYPNSHIDPIDIPEVGFIPIKVPGDWRKAGMGNGQTGFGIGSYVLRLENIPPGQYGLLLDTIYTSYDLFIEGQFVGNCGNPGSQAQETLASFGDTLVNFSLNKTMSLTIVIHVSNFYHPVGGMGVAPIIGPAQQVIRFFILKIGLSIALVALFLSGSFMFLLFYGRSEDGSNEGGLFALLCITLSLKLAASNSLLTWLLPSIPIWLVSKIEYGTIPVAAAIFLLYSQKAFKIRLPKYFEIPFFGIMGIYTAVVTIFPIIYYQQYISIITIGVIIGLLVWIILFVTHKGPSFSYLVVFGACVLVCTMVLQQIYYDQGIPNVFLNQIVGMGMGFFMLVHAHAFSERFIRAEHDIHILTRELETKVEERTKQLHELNEQLSWRASHDPLTEVYNRNMLVQVMKEEPLDGPVSVFFIDLDNFKYINDTYSHEHGDQVLKEFASYIKRICRSTDGIFRVGGDEFIIILRDTGSKGAEALAKRLLAFTCLQSTDSAAEDYCQITCSVGIAIAKDGVDNLDSLVRLADRALLISKKQGKNRYTMHLV
jgi:diguanylate cyclase (GGDEF)-like protein